MNGIEMVETGLILATRFSRYGDNALSICQSLMDRLGYGVQPGLKNKIDGLVMLDRGYHTPSVTKFFQKFIVAFLELILKKFETGHFASHLGMILKKIKNLHLLMTQGVLMLIKEK